MKIIKIILLKKQIRNILFYFCLVPVIVFMSGHTVMAEERVEINLSLLEFVDAVQAQTPGGVKSCAETKTIMDGDLTIEEGAQPYRPTENERLISEMKDQALTRALKFRIDFYAGNGIAFDIVKSLFPEGMDRVDLLEYLNGTDRKRIINAKRDSASLLIAPWQYDTRFYELQTSAKEYEKWVEEAQHNLQKGTWIVVEKTEQGRKAYVGVDRCHETQKGGILFRCNDVSGKGLSFSWTEPVKLYEQRVSNNRFVEVW